MSQCKWARRRTGWRKVWTADARAGIFKLTCLTSWLLAFHHSTGLPASLTSIWLWRFPHIPARQDSSIVTRDFGSIFSPLTPSTVQKRNCARKKKKIMKTTPYILLSALHTCSFWSRSTGGVWEQTRPWKWSCCSVSMTHWQMAPCLFFPVETKQNKTKNRMKSVP